MTQSNHASPPPDPAEIVAEAERLLTLAAPTGLVLRLLGGIAIFMRCPSCTEPPMKRNYGDLDAAIRRSQRGQAASVLENAGYESDRRFNALHGEHRFRYLDKQGRWHIDIFIGSFRMCHTLELEKRLETDPRTLSLADLLLTKLQIVQLNAKDAFDTVALLMDHEVLLDTAPPSCEAIDGRYIAQLCARDWGWHTTVMDNLEKVASLSGESLSPEKSRTVEPRIGKLQSALREEPKSLGWKLRALTGRRVPWYDEPEEI